MLWVALLKVGIDKYEVRYIENATFEMVKSLKEALRFVTKQLLEGQIRSVMYLDNQDQKAEHVSKINEINWSHSIGPYNGKSGKEEILNDIGSIVVNTKKAER